MAKVTDELFLRVVSFVESKLGSFEKKPTLVDVGQEEEAPEPHDPGAYVAFILDESTIGYASNIIPENVGAQVSLMLHEVSELRYDELSEPDIHGKAVSFVDKHYQEAGGVPTYIVDIELIKKGYYWSFVWTPERIFRRALEVLPSPLPPALEQLWEERKRRPHG